jgi:hypothetical protein
MHSKSGKQDQFRTKAKHLCFLTAAGVSRIQAASSQMASLLTVDRLVPMLAGATFSFVRLDRALCWSSSGLFVA